MTAAIVGRLAPTPSGELHLGNVCAFAAAWLSCRQQHGRLLLRMEDVDTTRARAHLEAGIRDDLMWLGIDWDEETPRQSRRDYGSPLQQLTAHTYHCVCTRREVRASGGVYAGTCRDRGLSGGSIRLRLPSSDVPFTDRAWGARRVDPTTFGDPVLVRRDGIVSYNLAVVADDITDGVQEVVRGADLLDYTAVQLLLWRLLGVAPPTWLHTPLILGPDERKLSKSHGSLSVRALRDAGVTPDMIWAIVLPWLGVTDATSLAQALGRYDPSHAPTGPFIIDSELNRSITNPRSPRPT